MNSPISWFGGKRTLSAHLLPLLPPHHTYVEPFAGGASLLFAKEPSPVETINDLDGGLVNFFRVLRDPQQFEAFHGLVLMTPWAREEYEFCRRTWDETSDPVERAYRFFVTARMSFSGKFGEGWANSIATSRRGMAHTCSRWLSGIEGLPEVHQRLLRVQIEHSDWLPLLARYDRPETLWYLDPPYVPETRRSGGYRHELTQSDHEKLVAAVRPLTGKILLSGYRHALYLPLEEDGWERRDFPTCCRATGGVRNSGLQGQGSLKAAQARVESVWLNPAAQAALGG